MRGIDSITWSTGDTTGGAGTSTATGYSPHLAGRIIKVHVDYVGAPPAGTTDFTLSDEADPASEAIVSLVNNATDTTLYPRRPVQDNAGADVTADGTNEFYEPFIACGRLEATLAQANDDDSATVTVWFELY